MNYPYEINKKRVIIPLLAIIPPEIKSVILLEDNDLQEELLRMTDRYKDEIFCCGAELGGIF